MEKLMLLLLLLATSAFAFDTIGTESGSGMSQTDACKSAKNSAENKAQLSAQLNSTGPNKVTPKIGSCECDKQSSGIYQCIVSWRVD